MDGDPAVEPELDSFSLLLPLPYRVALIIVLGVWAWGVNLHYLHLLKIDVPALIRYPPRASASATPHHNSCYRLATLLTLPLGASLFLFWIFTRASPPAVRAWSILPNLYLLLLLPGLFILPLPFLSRAGRHRFITTLRRIIPGGIAESHDGKFGDILLADALTSYAKVLGDLYVSLCLFFAGKGSTGHPDRSCGGRYAVPVILAIPSAIRLRQCLIEYSRARRARLVMSPGANRDQGWGGTHLANALKYSSAFPVIILGALQRGTGKEGDVYLYRLWLMAVLINSLYSFYWDVAKDWDLTMFSSEREHPEYPWGLRRHRFLHAKEIYYFVIVLDFMLRFTWSIKLSPHLDRYNDMEGGIFLMEVLEIFRRWIWIFLRVETEWVRNNCRGPAPDDILLSDFSNKIDED